MKRTRQASQTLFALLCIVFLLIYISVAFFPHAHSHRDADCALCLILQSARKILSLLTLCAYLSLAVSKLSLARVRAHILPTRDTTPVGLKVKLSN